MIIIKVGESEKLRFEPHLIGKDFVVTPRRGRRFPIPIGAYIYNDDELLGVVAYMLPEQFQRCRVMFDPPVAVLPDDMPDDMLDDDEPSDEMTQEEWEAMRQARDADHEPPLPGDTMVPVGDCGDIPVAGSIEELGLSDRLLYILAGHDLARLAALRSALSRGDEFMLALSGIGPKSLEQIKSALGWAEVASPDGNS